MISLRNMVVAPIVAMGIGLLLVVAAVMLLALNEPVYASPMNVGGTKTLFTPTVLSSSGVTETLSATDAEDGMRFNNDGRTFVVVNNANGATITLTFITQATLNGQPVDDKVVTVNTSTRKFIGPFVPSLYNVKSGVDNGRLYMTVSTSTNVSMTVLRLSAFN